MDKNSNVRQWRGSFGEWRKAMGWTQEEAAVWLETGRRRVQEIEAGSPDYRLRRPDLIAMQAVFEAKAKAQSALADAEGAEV